LVKVKTIIGNAKKTVLKELEFIVDSGSFNTVISLRSAKDLKIESLAVEEVTLADGRKAKAGLSVAYIKLLDREGHFRQAFQGE
jgi:predicted aspartyl protease